MTLQMVLGFVDAVNTAACAPLNLLNVTIFHMQHDLLVLAGPSDHVKSNYVRAAITALSAVIHTGLIVGTSYVA